MAAATGDRRTSDIVANGSRIVERGPPSSMRYLRVCAIMASYRQLCVAVPLFRAAIGGRALAKCFFTLARVASTCTNPDFPVQYDTVLGKGAFKTVYKGFDEREGIEVAWNQVRSRDFLNQGHKLTQEISVLKNMKHKNVMYFYDSWVDDSNGTVNFITELFTSGTLRQCVPSIALASPLGSCTL
jgi:hypothetical protein